MCYLKKFPRLACENNRCPYLNICQDHFVKHKIQKQYFTQKWNKFRLRIIDEHGKNCDKCLSKNSLQVHHIERIVPNPHLFYAEENCIVLCYECHKKLHDEAQEKYDDYQYDLFNEDEEVLCKQCGVNYHKRKFAVCYDCYNGFYS